MEQYDFTIPANGARVVNASGNRIYCESASAPFVLKSGNQTFKLKAKRTYVLKQGLNKFLLENPSAVPITVELHIGDDEIIDNEVLISGQINGDVKIVNSDTVGKTVIKVDDDQSQVILTGMATHLDNVKQILNPMRDMMQDNWTGKGNARRPYTSLANASFASVSNATVTIVAAASNVNGVLIKIADLSSQGNNGAVNFLVNGNVLVRSASATGIINGKSVQDIHVPAGQEISAVCGSSGFLSVFYEVL